MSLEQYTDLVNQAVSTVGLPSGFSAEQFFSLINAVIQKESSFNPNAVSGTGAGVGLMQVNPNVWLNVYNVTRDALFDPWTNVYIGSSILRDYINKYGVQGGLGAYFAGPKNRLSDSAKSYAAMVLRFYQSIRSRLKGLFQPVSSFTPQYWGNGGTDLLPIDLPLDEPGNVPAPLNGSGFLSGVNWTTVALIGAGVFILWQFADADL